jgi:hypothetical protein
MAYHSDFFFFSTLKIAPLTWEQLITRGVLSSTNIEEGKIMSDTSGSNKALYFIVGALLVTVLGLGYMYMSGQSANEPTLSIDVNEDGIDVDTND